MFCDPQSHPEFLPPPWVLLESGGDGVRALSSRGPWKGQRLGVDAGATRSSVTVTPGLS